MSLWNAIFGPGKMPSNRFRILKLNDGTYQVQELTYDCDEHEYVFTRAWNRDKNGTISTPMEFDTLREAEQGVEQLKKMYIHNESQGVVVGTY